jgi:hypothetical protein
MKMLTSVFAFFLLSVGFAAAQDLNGLAITSLHSSSSSDVTGFRAPEAPGVSPEAAKAMPNPKVVLKPQLGGVFVDGAKYGWEMISPGAPEDFGMGEKYLSAPSSKSDLQHESGQAAHRDTGGIKLFTFEF